jgi:hypothetical protein
MRALRLPRFQGLLTPWLTSCLLPDYQNFILSLISQNLLDFWLMLSQKYLPFFPPGVDHEACEVLLFQKNILNIKPLFGTPPRKGSYTVFLFA